MVMRVASPRLIGSVMAAVLWCAALAAPAWALSNCQGLWWAAPPESEAGWGINLAHQGDKIFATWFTYDVGGAGWWLSMTADKTAEGIYSGTLIETAGPAFNASPFDPAKVTRAAVGHGVLTFRDGNNCTFDYTVKGVPQTRALVRQVFGPLPTCTYGARPDFAAATNYQDLWWVPGGAEAGWGINLTHQGDKIFATWFTYDLDGTPLWLSMTADKVAPYVYSGQLIRTAGPAFNAIPFDPAKVTRTVVGTATFTFANGNAATFAYTLNGVSQTKAITRELFVSPAGTVCGEQGAIQGQVFGHDPEQALVCADVNGNGRCDQGEAQTLSDAAGRYELMPPTGFDGSLVAEVLAGQARASDQPGTTVDPSYRMASPAPGYSTHITPFTTLVQLTKETNFRLAEELVRNELGLPPRFAINLDAVPADGSLTKAVATSVVTALKATAATVDFSSPDALAQVVAAFPSALTDLPTLRITTKAGAPIVSKETYIDATFLLTNPAVSNEPVALSGQIRGRGHSTWGQPKNPYHVKFADDSALAALPEVLGMTKGRHWALLADYFDKSLLRNKLAYSLGNSSVFADGLKWTPSGQHLEVFLNGDYIGVYLLTETIRLDPGRLDIKTMSADPAVNDVDGGYIVEVDTRGDCYASANVNLQHRTPQGVPVCIDTPNEEDITPAQVAYVNGFLDNVEADVYGPGLLAQLNATSFADWYLLQELFRNWDAVFLASDFMWKDTNAAASVADRVLNMGPIWDFDISAGNVAGLEQSEGCWVSRESEWSTSWIPPLLAKPAFLDLVLSRWKQKRSALETFINSSIDTYARRIDAAQQRNFARWPVLGVPLALGDYFLLPTHAEQVAFLKHFLDERMTWLDRAYATPASFEAMCK
jgi:CotH kinase protein